MSRLPVFRKGKEHEEDEPHRMTTLRIRKLEDEQRKALRRLTNENSVKQEELASLKSKLMRITTEKADYDLQYATLEDEFHQLSRLVGEKESELEGLEHSFNSDMSDSMASNKIKIKEMKLSHETRVHEWQKQINARIDQFMREREETFAQEKAQLEKEIEQKSEEFRNFDQKLNDDLKAQKNEFECRLVKLSEMAMEEEVKAKATLEEISGDTRRYKGDLDAMEQKISESEKRHSDLTREIENKIKRSKSLQDGTFELQCDINNLSQTFSSKENDLLIMGEMDEFLRSQINKVDSQLGPLESERRAAHNLLQELKGNIRVFCRVRPVLTHESVSDTTEASFSSIDDYSNDQETILLQDPRESVSYNEKNTLKSHKFQFDKVFSPYATNGTIFPEISQLVQSALDGVNVCIFAYGQTGSGKTFTMSNPEGKSAGMIPRAVAQIFETAQKLKSAGWQYSLRGQFIEIYNESIHDLIGGTGHKKHEIRHDPVAEYTTVTDVEEVLLENPESVKRILKMANKNRSVAATKSNSRSSRSHSVFVIRIHGHNSQTSKSCDGTLNLVDLAGSERLSQSQATGDRLKETQAINKSLSCLGDVIHALVNNGKHIPYRNSKLTYLLQYSLGGNSKTLMFVNISPLKQHFGETLNSLRFATKVNSTSLG